jgi:hypothetical protein
MALRTPSVFQRVLGAGSSLASNSNPESESCDNDDMALGNGSDGKLIYHFASTIRVHTLFADRNTFFPEETSTAGPDTAHAVDTAHTTDATDSNLNAQDTVDAADAADADLLEEMANDPLSSTNPERDPPNEAQTAPLTPPDIEPQPLVPAPAQPTEPDANSSDASPQVFVDRFPHGSPGAAIAGGHQGSNIYQASHELFGASAWAPFHSQCDWELARWAKMRGPTSSAMEELLAIPEVPAH